MISLHGHGKGEHDGAGALLKHNAAKRNLNVGLPSLRNAADLVQFGTDELKERAPTTWKSRLHQSPDIERCAEGKWGGCENQARLPPYEWRKLEMTQVTQRMTRALVTDMAS
ncbi:hypothetical protein WJX74_001259 [Apatococcus lobatus]|uniref:Uncharacterized protein n=1 Tax=Apatococcus lobatus TaxID=904363 RepID=A0AAW1QH67_9CHLO